jgi:hypothetical protein
MNHTATLAADETESTKGSAFPTVPQASTDTVDSRSPLHAHPVTQSPVQTTAGIDSRGASRADFGGLRRRVPEGAGAGHEVALGHK